MNNVFEKLTKIPDLPKKEKNNQDLREVFERERKEITELIKNLNQKIRIITEIPELQVELYSYRQIIVEKRAQLYSTLSVIKKSLKNKRKKAYIETKTNNDISIKSAIDTNIFVEDYIREESEKIDLLELQINFMEESINTLDRVIFGIKNRISIEDFLVGN